MDQPTPNQQLPNVGIIATRLAGTDGVSLEEMKWTAVLKKEGFTCYYFAGELDRPRARSYIAEEAHFMHPEIREIHENVFGLTTRSRTITRKIHRIKRRLKDHLYAFINKYDIRHLVVENCLTIPLNIPLGVALTELIQETGLPTVAHHHDFYWERDHFMVNSVADYLNMAFPPNLPSIDHFVINSFADTQLSFRTGISAKICPNVMDFENPPPPVDEFASDVRQALGIEDDELLILQPTRVVKRKGIEHAIELTHRLGRKAKLVISHASGDEGYDYEQRLREYTELMDVNTIFVSDIIREHRGYNEGGHKIYTLEDIYPHADLVTYPSSFEGFGNAFLEAVYFKKPIVVNSYSIYTKDIKPKGFSVIEIDGYVTREAVEKAKRVLNDSEYRHQMVEHNYRIATKHYSYAVLHNKLRNYIAEKNWFRG